MLFQEEEEEEEGEELDKKTNKFPEEERRECLHKTQEVRL
jgi:hypothetical protein